MKILMHDNALNERGVTKAIESYAEILTQLGISVTIAFRSDNPGNVPEVIERIGNQFDLFPYRFFSEIERSQKSFDVAYFQKSGVRDGNILKIPSIVHSVFQEYDPHGDIYIYISQWLANKMNASRFTPRFLYKGFRGRISGCSNAFRFDYLPLASDVPRFENRQERDRFVILRYGGPDSFDVPWVQSELIRFIDDHKNSIALMVNTNQFCHHERIKFLPKFTTSEERNSLLASSDICLHARRQGESFGLFLVEAMQAGKQILSWAGGIDSHHVDLLRGTGALFSNNHELYKKLSQAYAKVPIVDTTTLMARAEQFRSHNIAPLLLQIISQVT